MSGSTFPKKAFEDTPVAKLGVVSMKRLNVPRLMGLDNFTDWESKLNIALEYLRLGDFIRYEITIREDASDALRTKYIAALAQANYVICMNIHADITDQIINAGWNADDATPWETFHMIKRVLDQISTCSLRAALDGFLHINLRDFNGDLTKYLRRLNYYKHRLGGSIHLDDIIFVIVAINGFRDSHPDWYSAWCHDIDRGVTVTKEQILTFLATKASIQREGKTYAISARA